MTNQEKQNNAHENDCQVVLIASPIGIELSSLMRILSVSSAPPAGCGHSGLGAQCVVLVFGVFVVGIVTGIVAGGRSGATTFAANLK